MSTLDTFSIGDLVKDLGPETPPAVQAPLFEAFPSIPRLRRGCTICEKIDGTNAQVYILDDGVTLLAGSRNRWVTPEADNMGFARWVAEHREELLRLGPGRHFGEWWGAGIQRRYGLAEKRFSLFNAARWRDAAERPACVGVVPILYEGDFTTTAVDDTLAELVRTGSRAAPGFMDPEGVVVYLTAARAYYKVTTKGDQHKGAAAVGG